MSDPRKCSILDALLLQRRVADTLSAREGVALTTPGLFLQPRAACAGEFHFSAQDTETAWRRFHYTATCRGPRHLLQCTVERRMPAFQVYTAGCGGGNGNGTLPPTTETLPNLDVFGGDLPIGLAELPAPLDTSQEDNPPASDGTEPEEVATPEVTFPPDTPDVVEPPPDTTLDEGPSVELPNQDTAEDDVPLAADDGEAIPGADDGDEPPDVEPEDLSLADSSELPDEGPLADAVEEDSASDDDFGYTDAGPAEETCPTAPLCAADVAADSAPAADETTAADIEPGVDTPTPEDVSVSEDIPPPPTDTGTEVTEPPPLPITNALPWPIDPIGGVVALCDSAGGNLQTALTTSPALASINAATFFFAGLDDFQNAEWVATKVPLTEHCIPLCYVWEAPDDTDFCEAEPTPPQLDLQSVAALQYEASESVPPHFTAWAMVSESGDPLPGAWVLVKSLDDNPTSFGLTYQAAGPSCVYLFASAWCE